MMLLTKIRGLVSLGIGLLALGLMPAGAAMAGAGVPTVISVSVPANGTYVLGQAIDFTVQYDQSVTLISFPSLPLTIGSATRTADYYSKTMREITFRYTVKADDLDTDGITLGSSLTLSGATITASDGTSADLTLNGVPSTSGILIGNPPPPAPVPTLTEWALVLFSLGLAGFAGFTLNQRRKLAV